MGDYRKYRRKQVSEMRPYVPEENLEGISISLEDIKSGSPMLGDMIARNPNNHSDRWLVSQKYFEENFIPA